MKIQVTLFCKTGKYKPMSTLIEVPTVEEFKENFDKYKKIAISNIAAKRYRDGASLIRDGYTLLKWRIYNPEERKKYQLEQLKKELCKKSIDK